MIYCTNSLYKSKGDHIVYINTETIFSMTQANQNFSVVARAADRNGEAVVFKNNRPKYLVVNMENSGLLFDLTEDEKTDIVAKRLLSRYPCSFEKLISFLEVNGIHVESSDEDASALARGIADGSMSHSDVRKWIEDHRKNNNSEGVYRT